MEITTHFRLHSQATRLSGSSLRRTGGYGAFTLFGSSNQGKLTPVARTWTYSSQCPKAFQPELFPLHSPLLRESLLVSFPPLSYMLKSSGSSYQISGRNEKKVVMTMELSTGLLHKSTFKSTHWISERTHFTMIHLSIELLKHSTQLSFFSSMNSYYYNTNSSTHIQKM